jgi:predicted DsbA family dithiol-disulfide isomerase
MNQPESIVNPAQGVITVWSDIGCPWATLALHTLRKAMAASQTEALVDHRAFPLEVLNRRPTPKHIVDAEIIAIGGLIGDLDVRPWSAPDWTYVVSTLPALEAVQAAKSAAVGGLQASDQLDEALRFAFFRDHQCVSVLSVILDVASGCPAVNLEALEEALSSGVARRSVMEQGQTARNPVIVCSPHVFSASGYGVSNPGAVYTWSGGPERGLPRLTSYDPSWTEELLTGLRSPVGDPNGPLVEREERP